MTYGKSNEATSWLYDPLYTLKTTIAGQILISMWAERLVEASPELTILQINTDGISVLINRSDYKKCLIASNKLMSETGMSYETANYKQMIISDVNNYIAEYEDGYCKYKGLYEIDKLLHKDPSMRIVPIALSDYFIKGIPIENTIKNHKNIYDFCLRLRVNKGWDAKIDYLNKLYGKFSTDFTIEEKEQILLERNWARNGKLWSNGDKIYTLDSAFDMLIKNPEMILTKTLQKTNRYYVSNKGGKLYKHHISNNENTGVVVGSLVTIFNDYIHKPMSEYDIDYNFYIRECNKIINTVESKQLTLW